MTAISQMVWPSGGQTYFPSRKRRSLVPGWPTKETRLLRISFSFIPLVDNSEHQAGFDATEYFIKVAAIFNIGLRYTLSKTVIWLRKVTKASAGIRSSKHYLYPEFLGKKVLVTKRFFSKKIQILITIITLQIALWKCLVFAIFHILQAAIPDRFLLIRWSQLDLAPYVDIINTLELNLESIQTILECQW